MGKRSDKKQVTANRKAAKRAADAAFLEEFGRQQAVLKAQKKAAREARLAAMDEEERAKFQRTERTKLVAGVAFGVLVMGSLTVATVASSGGSSSDGAPTADARPSGSDRNDTVRERERSSRLPSGEYDVAVRTCMMDGWSQAECEMALRAIAGG